MKIISSGRSIHSPEFYKKKQKARYIRHGLLSLAALALIILVVYFFRWERFLITEVVIADSIIIDREEVSNAVNRELSGYYLWVIPKNNALIYRRRHTRDVLMKEFPRFSTIAVPSVVATKSVRITKRLLQINRAPQPVEKCK